eukprot:CAMPEP_0178443114 /NCGR_PEP_ID=MMETSP0689_2-20121128/38654_1 /TAXON_ID=160604 /ORGANISM="Amphidinium massartii, Strain CS-259" /LENGTH=48 /DNA_ID= /DNA_START= /DNA_END= /DNA_ORIENTATION=
MTWSSAAMPKASYKLMVMPGDLRLAKSAEDMSIACVAADNVSTATCCM